MQQQQPQQVIYANGVPMTATTYIIETQPVRPRLPADYIASFERSASALAGGCQLFMGGISFGAATMALIVNAANSTIADGFWCGLFFLIGGAMALRAAKRSTRPEIKKANVFSVIAFAFAATQFGLSLDGLIINIYNPPTTWTCWNWWYYWYSITCSNLLPAMEAANSILVVAAGLQMLCNVAEIYICSKALCCETHVNPNSNADEVADAIQLQLQHQQQQQAVNAAATAAYVGQQQQQQPMPQAYYYPPQQSPMAPAYMGAPPEYSVSGQK